MSEGRETVLELEKVTKNFSVSGARVLRACDNVSLTLYKGETLGIVGESGCGKSTLAKMIMHLHQPTSGNIRYCGSELTSLQGEALRQSRCHIQMVFQDPAQAFNPRMKIKDIICEPLHNFTRLSNRQTTEKAAELLQLVELSTDFAERYSANMSGGQRQRVAIARALALAPAVLVCDEATSALDVSVQKKVVDLLIRIQRERNLSILFICHDLALMSQLSHRIAVMYLGNIVEVIDSARLPEAKHPYTQALIQSVFPVDVRDKNPIPVLEGELPSPIDLPQGCPFQTRCGFRQKRCAVEKPILRELNVGHSVACHLVHMSM